MRVDKCKGMSTTSRIPVLLFGSCLFLVLLISYSPWFIILCIYLATVASATIDRGVHGPISLEQKRIECLMEGATYIRFRLVAMQPYNNNANEVLAWKHFTTTTTAARTKQAGQNSDFYLNRQHNDDNGFYSLLFFIRSLRQRIRKNTNTNAPHVYAPISEEKKTFKRVLFLCIHNK